jgi:DNA-directed RNA polymerase specialized sigma24 family protein
MRALDTYACHSPLAQVVSFETVVAEQGKDGQPVGDIAAPYIPFEDIIAASDAAAAIRQFVYSLPKSHQDMVFRHFWDGESQAEIARTRGVTGAAISKSMAKILKQGRVSLSSYRNAHLHLQAA